MLRRDIVVMGGSAGSLPVLQQIVGNLPPDLPAAVLVVIHFAPHAESHLAQILTRAGPLPAAPAEEGEPVRPGRIYVARPDQHLLVQEGRLHLQRGPRENRFRPAIDVLFRSAARVYGPRVAGVLLSGQLSDGVMGLMAIKLRGGVALVQDPAEARHPSMPATARQYLTVDYTLKGAEISPTLVTLATEPVSKEDNMADMEDMEQRVIEADFVEQERDERDGLPALVSCPDCGGTLWEFHQGRFLEFRCHVGHRYAFDALLLEQTEALERALWTCVRMLKEKVILAHQLAHRSRLEGHAENALHFEENARADEESIAALQQLIQSAAVGHRFHGAIAGRNGPGANGPDE